MKIIVQDAQERQIFQIDATMEAIKLLEKELFHIETATVGGRRFVADYWDQVPTAGGYNLVITGREMK